jgi:hypothetical protein
MALPAAPALRQPPAPVSSTEKVEEQDTETPQEDSERKSSFRQEKRDRYFFGVKLVQQALTKLQGGVAQFVSAATVHGRDGQAVMRYLEDAQMWLELPQIFEVGAVVALQQVAVAGHMSDVILEVMDWLPREQDNEVHSALSFGSFLQQIEQYDNSQQALTELLEVSVECLVVELLVVTTQYFKPNLALTAGAVHRIVKTAMKGLLSLTPKHPALPVKVYQELRTHANKQWSLVLARLCSAHANVILPAFSYLMKGRGVDGDAVVETPLEDGQALAVMECMVLMNADLKEKLHVSALSNLLEEHLHWLELKVTRPFAVAAAQLRAIEALLCNSNFGRTAYAPQLTSINDITVTMMHFMELLFHNLNNWGPRKSSEKPLVPIVNFVMAAILVRTNKEFYGSQIQLFLHKKLLKSSLANASLRENALQCVLFVLRGPEFIPRNLFRGHIQGYIPPLPRNPILEKEDPADPPRSDPYVCTIADFEGGTGKLFRHDQLSWIQEALFPIKAGAQMKDMVKAIPLCTHVLVQVAANYLGAPDHGGKKGRSRSASRAKAELAGKDMHAIDLVQLLLDFKVHKQMTYLLVALRAMQIMLNSETGFLKGARTSHVNTHMDDGGAFDDAIEQLKIIVAISIQEQLPKILELAGTDAMGICEEDRTMPNILESTKPDAADIINSMPTNHKARLHIQVLQEMLRTLPFLNWRSGLRSFGYAALLLHKHEPIAVSSSVAFQKCSLNTPQYRPACIEILVEMIDSPSPRALETHSLLTVLKQQAMLLKTWRRVMIEGIDGRARQQAAEDELNIVVEEGDTAEPGTDDHTQYLPWMRKLESQAVCFLAHGEVKVRVSAFELLELVFQIRNAREALAAEMVSLKGGAPPPTEIYRWPCVWEILHAPSQRGMLVQQALYRRRLVGSAGVVQNMGTDMGSANAALSVAASSGVPTTDMSPVGSLLRSSSLWTHTIPGVCSALVQHANPELVLSIRGRLFAQIQQQVAYARASTPKTSQPAVAVVGAGGGGSPTEQKEKEMYQHRHAMLFAISGVALTRQQYKAGWRIPVSPVWDYTLHNQRTSVEEAGAGEGRCEESLMEQMLESREHLIGYISTARAPASAKNGTSGTPIFGANAEVSLKAYTASTSAPQKKNEVKLGATGSWLWDGLLLTDDAGSNWIYPALQMACVSAHPYVAGMLAASLQQWYASVQKQLTTGKSGSARVQQEKQIMLSRVATVTTRLLRYLTLAPGSALWQVLEPRPDLDDRMQPSQLQPTAAALLAMLSNSGVSGGTGSMVKMATSFAAKLDMLILVTTMGTGLYQFRLQVSLVDHTRVREIAMPPDWDFDDRYRLYVWLRRTHPWPLPDTDWDEGGFRDGSQNVIMMKHAMRAMAALLLQGPVLKDEDVVVLLQEAAGRKASLMNLQWFVDADRVVAESYASMHATGPDMSAGIDSTCIASSTGTLILTSPPQIPSNAPCCLLRHLLSYHPKELGYMSTTCVNTMQRPNALRFFHALADQVLPDRSMPQASTSGVVADMQLHLKALANWGRRLDHAHLTHHGMLSLLRKSTDEKTIYTSVVKASKRASMAAHELTAADIDTAGEMSFHEMEQVSFTRPAAADPAVNSGLSTSWGKRGEAALLLLGLRALLDPDRHTRTRAFMLVQRSILGVVLMAEMYLEKEPETDDKAAKMATLQQHATVIDTAMTDKRRRFDGESYEDIKKDAATIASDVARCLGACALVSEAVVGWPLETFTRAKNVTSVLVAFFEEVFERPMQRPEWGGADWNTLLISDFCAQVDINGRGMGREFMKRLFTFSILNQSSNNMTPWKKLLRSTPDMESPHPNLMAVMGFLVERYCEMLQTKHATTRTSTPEEQLMQDIVGCAFKAHPASTVAILVKNLSIQAPEYSSAALSYGKRTMLQLTASVFLYELALTDMEPLISHMPLLLTTILLLFPSASIQRKFQRANNPNYGANLDNMLGETLPGLLHNLVVGMAPHLHGLKEGKTAMAGARFDFESSEAQSLAASTNELAALLLCNTVELDWEMEVEEWKHLPGVESNNDGSANVQRLNFRPLKRTEEDGAILSEHGSTRSLMESQAINPHAHHLILTPNSVSGGVPIRAFITQLLKCLGDEESGEAEVAGQGRYNGKSLRAAMAQQALGWALHSAGAAIGDTKRGEGPVNSFDTAQLSEAARVCQRAHRLLQLLVRGSDAAKMVAPLLLRLGRLITELETLYEQSTTEGFAVMNTVPAQLERIRALSNRQMAEPQMGQQLGSAVANEEIKAQAELEASQAHLFISIAAKEVFYSLQASLVTMLRAGGAGAALGAHEVQSKKVLAQTASYAVALLRAPDSASSGKLGVFQDLGGVSQVEIIFDLGLQLLVSLLDMVKSPQEVLSAMLSVPASLTAPTPQGIGALQLAPLLQHGFAITPRISPACTHLTMRALLHLIPTYMHPTGNKNLKVCDDSALPLFRLLLLPLPWLVMRHGGQHNYDTSKMRTIVASHLPAGNQLEDGTSIPRPADAKQFALDLAATLRPGYENGSSFSEEQKGAIRGFVTQLELYAGEGVPFEGFVAATCKAVWEGLALTSSGSLSDMEEDAATLLTSTLGNALKNGTAQYQTAVLHVLRHFALMLEGRGREYGAGEVATTGDRRKGSLPAREDDKRVATFGEELVALVPWVSFIAISGKALQSAVNEGQQMDRDLEARALVAGVRMRKQSVTGIGVFKPSGTSIQQAALAAIEALVALSLHLTVGDLMPILEPDKDPGALKKPKKKMAPLVAPWMTDSAEGGVHDDDGEDEEDEEEELSVRDQIMHINIAMADEAGIEMRSDVRAVQDAISAAKTMHFGGGNYGAAKTVPPPQPPPQPHAITAPSTIPPPTPPPIDEPRKGSSIMSAVGSAAKGVGNAIARGSRLTKKTTGDEFHEESSTAKAIAAQKAKMGGIDMSALRANVKNRAPTAGSGSRGSIPEGAAVIMSTDGEEEETEFV